MTNNSNTYKGFPIIGNPSYTLDYKNLDKIIAVLQQAKAQMTSPVVRSSLHLHSF